MKSEQLAAYGKMIATIEYILDGKVNEQIVEAMLRNPAHPTDYWFAEAMKTVVKAMDDITGIELANIYKEVGDMKVPTPVEIGKIRVAYYKAKADLQKMDVRQAFAAKLRAARESRGLSSVELAKLAGIPQSHVSRIESGKYSVSLDTIARLDVVLGGLLPISEIRASASVVFDNPKSKTLTLAEAKNLIGKRIVWTAPCYQENTGVASVNIVSEIVSEFDYAKRITDFSGYPTKADYLESQCPAIARQMKDTYCIVDNGKNTYMRCAVADGDDAKFWSGDYGCFVSFIED